MPKGVNKSYATLFIKVEMIFGFSHLILSFRHHFILKAILAIALIYTIITLTDRDDSKSLHFEAEKNLDLDFYCKWSDHILANSRGKYKLCLCYDSLVPNYRQPQAPRISESKIRKNGTNRLLNFEELADIPDRDWLRSFDQRVYDLYPQTATKENVRRVLEGLPLLEVSKNITQNISKIVNITQGVIFHQLS